MQSTVISTEWVDFDVAHRRDNNVLNDFSSCRRSSLGYRLMLQGLSLEALLLSDLGASTLSVDPLSTLLTRHFWEPVSFLGASGSALEFGCIGLCPRFCAGVPFSFDLHWFPIPPPSLNASFLCHPAARSLLPPSTRVSQPRIKRASRSLPSSNPFAASVPSLKKENLLKDNSQSSHRGEMVVDKSLEAEYAPTKKKKAEEELEKRRKKITPGCLMKAIIRSGDGKANPADGDQVILHCTTRTLDGIIVDSTRSEHGGKDNPIRNVLGKSKMILGFVEGIPTMTKGEVAMFKMKPEIHYAEEDCPLTYLPQFKMKPEIHYAEEDCPLTVSP
ncbi:uncharacterized protein LOC141844876 [Curcuma longa]|uniref:uncharacterized protein LOC141844876 n=1 Tax=Curcuma longa TaxID=136217 RepID=UPI003D9F237E